jgi:endonuclease/exonuclease/phosphatase family metal-dependent hydrolase
MKLSVLQWNVWYQEAADNIVSFIKQADPDIACLQELTANSFVNPGRNIPQEIADLGYHHVFVPTLERSGNDHIVMGNGIFSRFPITKHHSLYVQRSTDIVEAPDKENRMYLEALIRLDSTDLTVGNAHLSYTHDYVESAQKARETELLLAAIGRHKNHFVLCTDTNALPESDTMGALTSILRNAGPPLRQASWTTKRHVFPRAVMEGLNWRVDYMLSSEDITVIKSDFLNTDVSDHLPIRAVISIG